MDIKDFNKIYMESLANQVADWHDSLGGKIVGGIGSLFKLGGKGIKAGAKKSSEGIKSYFKQRKTKQKIQAFIKNATTIYDPANTISQDNIKNLIENKAELQYLMDLSGESLPPNLKRFLDIFKNCGTQISNLLQQNKNLALDNNKIQALVQQGLLQKIETFKESIKNSITSQNIDFNNIYLNIILESASKDQIQQELLNLNFSQKNNMLSAKFDGLQLKNWLQLDGDITNINGLINIIEKDNMEINALASTDKLTLKIKSDISNQFIEYNKDYDDPTKTKDILISSIKQYYLSNANAKDNKTELKNQLSIIKLQNYNNVLNNANFIILNKIKWTGWFGSLKNVLKQAAACNIKIEDIKILALLYFHISFIK